MENHASGELAVSTPKENGKGSVNDTRTFPFMLFQNKLETPLTQDECEALKGLGCDRALSIAVLDNKSPVIQPNTPQKNFRVFLADVPLHEMVEMITVLANTVGAQPQTPFHVKAACQAFIQSVVGNPMAVQPPKAGIVT